MEPTSDKRFDPNYAAQILLDLSHEQSLDQLLQKLIDRAMERHMDCAQVWLIEKGDLCATCPRRPDCPDQSRCLHLVAAKGNSVLPPGRGFGRLDPQSSREPLGVPPIGSVVASGQQRSVPDLSTEPASSLDPDWMREEGIQGYAVNPISYKGEVLGAIVTGSRGAFQEELRPWGVLIANQVGAAIANARAFEEVRLAGKRLEEANQKLAQELAERKRAEEALRRVNRELRAISSCNQVLLRATDEQSLLREICNTVCKDAGYQVAWVGYAEQDEAKSVRPVAWTGTDQGFLTSLGITWTNTERGRGPCGTAIRTGRTFYVEDYATDPRTAPWKEVALQHGFLSAIALPLKDEQNQAFGSLNLYSAQPKAFAAEEIRMLEELAGDLAFGITTMRSRAARQRAEKELRESEKKYQELVEHANSIILHWQRDGRIIHLNEFGQRFFGYTENEIRGRHVLGTIVPDTESRGRDLHKLMEEISANPSAFEQNVNENMRRDGERVWIAWTNKVVLNKKGEVTEILSIGVDITERKRTEEALQRSEAYLAEGQRLSHTGSWAWSPITLEPLYFSGEMFRIFGLDSKQGVPTNEVFRARVHPEDRDRVYESLLKVAQRASDYEHEHRIILPDGSVRHIRAIGHPVRDETGKLVEYVGTAMDVTERKRAEDELRKHREHLEELVKQRTEELVEAKARAEAANREKSRFLANMSHELRTPLNAVLGFSRLLKSGPDVTPRQQEALDIIARSGEHLLNLINNVLDMAKIESGGMALEETEVDLHQLVHEIQSLMGVGAAEKGLRFTLERAPELPRFVAVDAGKLRQVLINLVGNAIKYTDAGGVKLRAGLTSQDGPERAQVRFEIEDSGPGIGQQDSQRIFFPFVQLGEKAPTRAGTGLGLAICKQYVELMGGQIGVASEPGKGSVFFFRIPVRVLPSVAEPDEPAHGRVLGLAEGQPRYRLLIVEDQAENRLLLRRLLDPLGFELREALNGQQAVTLFDQWHPDLIWMDIRMPVMDGLEAVRRIRATKAGSGTKIIALTAHALEEERRPIMAAGCDDFVRKPFREQEIFDTLARHLRLKFIYEEMGHPERTPEVPEFAFSPAQLDHLPMELLRDLRQSVIELDTARTQALIAQVTQRDACLGQALNTLATHLDYNRLLKLLET